MGGAGAAAAAALAGRPAARLADARDPGCDLLRAARRRALAPAAALLPATADRVWLVRRVSRRRRVGSVEPSPGDAGSRARRPRGQPECGRDRQPERQDHRAGGPRGYDAGKKISGRKRHALVDTDGRPLVLHCHPASVQDRDGAAPLLRASRARFPFIAKAFADAAYAARRVATATHIAIEIVRKPKHQVGFAVHPRRWVVERCFAWLGRNRRLARDFEATITSATAFLYAASVSLLTRRIARSA